MSRPTARLLLQNDSSFQHGRRRRCGDPQHPSEASLTKESHQECHNGLIYDGYNGPVTKRHRRSPIAAARGSTGDQSEPVSLSALAGAANQSAATRPASLPIR